MNSTRLCTLMATVIGIAMIPIGQAAGRAAAQGRGSGGGGGVTATINLVVPDNTPQDSAPFIAGNALTPPWRADGVRMQRLPNGSYSVTLNLPAGTTLEYKFTRGSWQSVEKAASGADISNRRRRIEAGMVVTDTVVRWGQGGTAGSSAATSLTGNIKRHPDFSSKQLTNRRSVIVYLPPDYDAAQGARYPVLYMHDGQNLFDRATAFGGREWEMDETAERLIREKKIEPLIIVGVYNTSARMSEYTPVGANPVVGRTGDDYTRFVTEELKPFIDSVYRTRPGRDDTGIAGSSLGGLISLGMAMSHPNVFGKVGVVSPSLFWNDGQLLKEAARLAPTGALGRVRYWIDIGTREQAPPPGDSVITAVRNTRRLVEEFRAAGLTQGRDYFYLEVPDGQHNESWWARRMDQMLVFLFPARQQQQAPIRISHNSKCGTCSIVLEKYVTLGRDGQPDSLIIGPIRRDSRGRYLGVSYGRTGIIVYDSTGNFLTYVRGQWAGGGTGARAMGVEAGPGDSLYLFSAGGVFSVYAPDYSYVRTATLPRSDVGPRTVLRDGRMLFSFMLDAVVSETMLLQLSDGQGRSLGSFASSRLSRESGARSGAPVSRQGRAGPPPVRFVPFVVSTDQRSAWIWSPDGQIETRFDQWGIDDTVHTTVLLTDLPSVELPVRSTLLGVDESGRLWTQRLLTSEMTGTNLESVLEIVDVAERRILATLRLARGMNVGLIHGTQLLAMSPNSGTTATRREIMRVRVVNNSPPPWPTTR